MIDIQLILAKLGDENLIHTMKYHSFLPLFNRYHDDKTSPVKESINKVIAQLNSNNTDYYITTLDSKPVGAIRVVNDGMEDGEQIINFLYALTLCDYSVVIVVMVG